MMYEMYKGTALEAYYKAQLDAIELEYEELMKSYDKKYEDLQNKMTELVNGKTE